MNILKCVEVGKKRLQEAVADGIDGLPAWSEAWCGDKDHPEMSLVLMRRLDWQDLYYGLHCQAMACEADDLVVYLDSVGTTTENDPQTGQPWRYPAQQVQEGHPGVYRQLAIHTRARSGDYLTLRYPFELVGREVHWLPEREDASKFLPVVELLTAEVMSEPDVVQRFMEEMGFADREECLREVEERGGYDTRGRKLQQMLIAVKALSEESIRLGKPGLYNALIAAERPEDAEQIDRVVNLDVVSKTGLTAVPMNQLDRFLADNEGFF